MKLSREEAEQLKPMYDFYVGQLQAMHQLDLDAEDLALVLDPNSA